ncbi:MAG: CRISPR-associated endonuclease Cas1 [Bacteroidota bacterium]
MQLVLDTNGLIVKKRNNAFYIVRKQEKRLISPSRITSIAVTADCLLSSAAIRLSAQHKIPIYFMDGTGQAKARLWSAQFGSIATIRREQTLFALEPEATEWIISLFRLKTENQIECLRYLRLKKRRTSVEPNILSAIRGLESSSSKWEDLRGETLEGNRSRIMGVEGNLARQYWQTLSVALGKDWQFSARSRRPAKDIFNASINYLYGMLYNEIGTAALAAGLDPHLGFLHKDEYNRPTFVFDLIEPFRPWVDRLLLELIWSKKLDKAHFSIEEGKVTVNSKGKFVLIPAFNEWKLKKRIFLGKKMNHRNHFHTFAGEFAQQLQRRNQEE